MLGNDIVDLRDSESDPETLHPRFDARVFAPVEREALALCEQPEILRWQLFAAKEAAYKATKKVEPHAVFSPVRFEVMLEAENENVREGAVTRGERRCKVRVETRDGAVHAIARLEDDDAPRASTPLVHGVLRVAGDTENPLDPEAQGRLVRSFSCERLGPALGVNPRDLEIRKRGRIPELWLRGAPSHLDLSLSHHGSVVAFACETSGAVGRAFGGCP